MAGFEGNFSSPVTSSSACFPYLAALSDDEAADRFFLEDLKLDKGELGGTLYSRKALAKFAKAQNSSISALLDAPASSVGAGGSESLASVLLEPTRLYASTMAAVRQVKGLRGAAHITGGGLTENLPRALPDHLRAVCKPWVLTPLFEWLRAACGGLPDDELLRTFNAGIGLVLVVSAADAAALKAALAAANEGGIIDLGVLEAKAGKPDCEVIGAMCSA